MNADQIDYWNGAAGRRWTQQQVLLDRSLRPFSEAALARAAAAPGEHVLDVGCGCGETLLELATRVGERGRATGVDISAPMLARARARLAGHANAQLIEADAAQLDLTGFDLIFSRFGVMFFEDPLAAFSHLRRALKPGGRTVFTCWRGYADNPWCSAPADIVRALLPEPPPLPSTGTPGPFAFVDPARVEAILRGAGFAEIAIERFDSPVVLSTGDLAEAVDFTINAGPTANLLPLADEATQERGRVAIAALLEAQRGADRITLPGSTWLVSARG